MKNYHELGFSKSIKIVDDILEAESKQADERLQEMLNELENFITNFGSLCYAQGYQDAKEEDIKITGGI